MIDAMLFWAAFPKSIVSLRRSSRQQGDNCSTINLRLRCFWETQPWVVDKQLLVGKLV